MSCLGVPSSISLISSASSRFFPANTRSEFSNLLATPMFLDDVSTRIYVQASSLGLSTLFDGPPPNVIKVHIRDLVCQVEDQESARCVGVLKYPPAEVAPGFALHTFENTLFLPLSNPQSQHFKVRLTDENNENLRLSRGGATILNLAVTDDEMRARSAFAITCSSHHPRMYPGNTLSSFVSPLLTELRLGDRYEVALQSIDFPPRMYERTVAVMRIEDEIFRYRLSEIADTQTFLNNVQMDVIESRLGAELHFERENGRAKMTRGEIGLGDAPDEMVLGFNREFFLACGDTRHSRERVTLRRGESFTFDGAPDINLAIPSPVALLESSVVENSMVGDGKMNVLHCTPVGNNGGGEARQLYIPHKLFFRPVTRNPMHSISFKFTNPDGGERRLKTRDGENGRIMITLAFRKRK